MAAHPTHAEGDLAVGSSAPAVHRCPSAAEIAVSPWVEQPVACFLRSASSDVTHTLPLQVTVDARTSQRAQQQQLVTQRSLRSFVIIRSRSALVSDCLARYSHSLTRSAFTVHRPPSRFQLGSVHRMSSSSLPAAYASLSLQGKVALITGGSSGIGAATARLFAARGAKVVIAARREKESNALVQELTAAGGEATFIQCDVTKEADIKAAVDAAVKRYGRLDVAFNNAGAMGPQGPTHEQSGDALTAVLELNVKSVYLCLKYEVAQILKQQKEEAQADVSSYDQRVQPNDYYKTATRYSIINNASIFGQVGLPTFSAYSATKHAVLGITKSAASEYAKLGIRVNAVNYGFVVTEITSRVPIDYMVSKVPVGRVGQGVEAAEVAAWLASDASSFVTGSAITCDGGVTCCGM